MGGSAGLRYMWLLIWKWVSPGSSRFMVGDPEQVRGVGGC
jgi:hypothetical protein